MGATTAKVSSEIIDALMATGIKQSELPSYLGVSTRSTSDRWLREGQCSVPIGQLCATLIEQRTGKRLKLKHLGPGSSAKTSKAKRRRKPVGEAPESTEQEEFVLWLVTSQDTKETLIPILDALGIRHGLFTDL